MITRASWLRRALTVCALWGVAGAACDSDGGTATEVTDLALSVSSLSLGVGASTQLLVYAVFDGGSAPRSDGISWTTSNAAVASVDDHGNVRGESLGGPATITAALDGRSAHATIVVVPASVEISPRISTLAVGASVQFSATARNYDGVPIAAGSPQWSVSFTSGEQVATITPDGRLTVLTPGVIVVDALMSGQHGQHEVQVPSAFDGGWSGMTESGAAIEFVVQFGVVTSFRFPNTLRQACTRQSLSLQTGVIGAGNQFALSLPGLTDLVTGTFMSPASMSGAHGEIQSIVGCAASDPIPASTFTASR